MKTIFLHIKNEKGLKPQIQDLDYWVEGGYKFITHETNNAITLSKEDIKTDFHACFLPGSAYSVEAMLKSQKYLN